MESKLGAAADQVPRRKIPVCLETRMQIVARMDEIPVVGRLGRERSETLEESRASLDSVEPGNGTEHGRRSDGGKKGKDSVFPSSPSASMGNEKCHKVRGVSWLHRHSTPSWPWHVQNVRSDMENNGPTKNVEAVRAVVFFE